MVFRSILGGVMLACIAGPLFSFDLTNMTDEERQIFRDEVRAYLLQNPEVLIEAITVLEEREAAQAASSDADLIRVHADALFDDGYSFVGGNPDGDITVVEFLDYRCGYCRKAHPEVSELISSDGNIRFVIKEFPILGEESTEAARFALAARIVGGDGAYMDAHDALMDHTGRINDGSLRRMAKAINLDADLVIEEMDSPAIDQIILQNYDLARALNVTGTPGFVIGETMLRGYAPLNAMQQIVDGERNGS